MKHTAQTLDTMAEAAIDAIRANGGASSWRFVRCGATENVCRRLYHAVCPVADFTPSAHGITMTRNGDTRTDADMTTGALELLAGMGWFNMEGMRNWIRVYPDSAEARELFS